MNTATGTAPLCGHCGRPVIGQPGVYWNGIVYHMACTRSPYKEADIDWSNTKEIDRMRREARPYSEFKREVLSKLNKPK